MNTWQNYDNEGEKFFRSYEALKFEEVHQVLLPYLPVLGAKCLDVGAGSGRDAAAMARLGYVVTAVEPSKELTRLGKEKHLGTNIHWIDDTLPKLERTLALNIEFEFILLSAVWMHIVPSDRPLSLKTISRLLAPKSHVAFTLRIGPSDSERMMYPVLADELREEAEEYGLVPVYSGNKKPDSMNREGIFWEQAIFIKKKA